MLYFSHETGLRDYDAMSATRWTALQYNKTRALLEGMLPRKEARIEMNRVVIHKGAGDWCS